MWYKIRTGDSSLYRGWQYTISADNNNDLIITIMSAYSIELPPPMSSGYNAMKSLLYKVNLHNIERTITFKEKIRFLGIFTSLTPNLEKGHEVARRYIDQNLGDFNIEIFYRNFL